MNKENEILNNIIILEEAFKFDYDEVEYIASKISEEKGWWEKKRTDGELIALMHSELSEALEALRNDNPKSEKIPEYTCLEEELADVIIRIMDYSDKKKLRVSEAIIAKMKYNLNRPHRHGGKKF